MRAIATFRAAVSLLELALPSSRLLHYRPSDSPPR